MLENKVYTIKRLFIPLLFVGVMQFFVIAVASAAVVNSGAEQLPSMMGKAHYAKVLETINRLPVDTQQRLDIRFYHATSLARTGKNSEAIVAFERLIADKPHHPEFYNNLAMLLVEEGKLLKAQQTLELGLRSSESYAMLYNNLTVVFETMARRSYAKALRVKKGDSSALSPLLSLKGFTPPVMQVAVAAVDEQVEPPAIVVASIDQEENALNRQITSLLNHWIESWQKKDIDGYIDSYSPNFKSRSYSSRQAWMEGRNERISRANRIEISITDIVVDALSTERIQTDFVMDYRSDRYSDRTKKRVVFKRIAGEWRIVRELTLAVFGS